LIRFWQNLNIFD